MQSRSCKISVILYDKMMVTQQISELQRICDCVNEAFELICLINYKKGEKYENIY